MLEFANKIILARHTVLDFAVYWRVIFLSSARSSPFNVTGNVGVLIASCRWIRYGII